MIIWKTKHNNFGNIDEVGVITAKGPYAGRLVEIHADSHYDYWHVSVFMDSGYCRVLTEPTRSEAAMAMRELLVTSQREFLKP